MLEAADALDGALTSMSDACRHLPDTDLCIKLVAAATRSIPSPKEHICTLVCNAEAVDAKALDEDSLPHQRLDVKDATPCDKCKMTVLEIRMVINNPTVQDEIVNITRTLCDRVPPYQEQCRSYVDLYSPIVFNELKKYFQPDNVCQLLHICPAAAATSEAGMVSGFWLWLEEQRQELSKLLG